MPKQNKSSQSLLAAAAARSKALRLALPLAMLASVSSIAVNAQAAVTTTATTGATTTTSSTTSNTVKAMGGSLTPFGGSLTPFWGSLTPFGGSLTPFWGSLTPSGGSLTPFWGSLTPFDGGTAQLNPYTAPTSSVNGVSVFWGTTVPYTNNMTAAGLNTYWLNTGVTMKNIDTAWGAVPAGSAASAYAPLVTQLTNLGTDAATFWNSAIKAKTGGIGYKAAVSDPLLAKYGIDLTKPTTLGALDQTKRAMFFIDFYDSLMNYTGTDHIDYWMNLVNWSPSLTQAQSSGTVSTIGLLDLTVSGTTTVSKNIVSYDGVSTFNNGHGVAVGSLMVGAHDGKGVMGIAPRAKVIAYNPFDASGTTNWTDVTTGVIALTTDVTGRKGASIVNASLGEPGLTLSPGWNTVFTSAGVSAVANKTVFVIAAGNGIDVGNGSVGVAQTTNVTWDFAKNPDILLVGSVGVDGKISTFSNTPGNACLLPSPHLRRLWFRARSPCSMIVGNGWPTIPRSLKTLSSARPRILVRPALTRSTDMAFWTLRRPNRP
jgi:Subtilase family